MAIVPDGARALSFTRHLGAGDLAAQRAVFRAACVAGGWSAGGSVCEVGPGLRAWRAVIRLVAAGGYDLVVVDTWERLAPTAAGRVRVLAALRRAGVRLVLAAGGVDTGDAWGAAVVDELIGSARPAVAR